MSQIESKSIINLDEKVEKENKDDECLDGLSLEMLKKNWLSTVEFVKKLKREY